MTRSTSGWLTLDDAIAQLSYERDIEVVRSFAAPRESCSDDDRNGPGGCDRDRGRRGALLIAVIIVVWRTRRSQVRRVIDIASLEDSPPSRESRRLDKNMTRLEHAVDAAVLARGEATVSAGRLSNALEAVAQGVVICDDSGDVVTRNGAATTLEAERYGDGPVGSIVEEMLQRAIDGKTDDARSSCSVRYGAPWSCRSHRSTTSGGRSAGSRSSTTCPIAVVSTPCAATSSPT